MKVRHAFVKDVRNVMDENRRKEVPPTTFAFVPDKGLHRNLKGRSQVTRIHSKMNILEKSYAPSICLGRVEYCDGNGLKISNIIDDLESE
ncbi:hypothetical protein GOBAR_DD12292 [Gossypium barbadense]|nr:hypothetical protein GOBAR_DD12292 [Gossypium barbadense]